jgi:hypothetical protein
MPIGYLDVPTGVEFSKKRELVEEMYEALHEAFPFPDDTRIFLREWADDSVSQNGLLGPAPTKGPVFTMHVPEGVDIDVKRTMLKKINAAVRRTYPLPDFMTFLAEYPLNLVVVDGGILADDQQRVEDQTEAYSQHKQALSPGVGR